MFPKIDPLILDLLKESLRFDPNQRLTVDQMISHKFYAQYRQPKSELTRDPIIFGP